MMPHSLRGKTPAFAPSVALRGVRQGCVQNDRICHEVRWRWRPGGSSRARFAKAEFRPRACYGAGAQGSALVRDDGLPLLHVVFVAPQIHWNSGNIGRTCLGLGARLHLVGPLGFSLDEKQVRRAGLDYWQHVDVRVYEDWPEFAADGGPMSQLGGSRYFFTKFGSVPAVEVDFAESWIRGAGLGGQQPLVLVFGSEVDGFTVIRDWLDNGPGRSERRVAFPMVDERFRSFNLSTTASMALWDAYKSLASAAAREKTVPNVSKTFSQDAAHAAPLT